MHRSRPICRFDTDCQSPVVFHELFPSLIRLADLSLQHWEPDAFVDGQFHDVQSTIAPPPHRLYFLPEPQGHGSFRPDSKRLPTEPFLNPHRTPLFQCSQ
jgi:hypothetical protein